MTRKPAFAHFGEDEKKPFDVIYYLYKMKQFYWTVLEKSSQFLSSEQPCEQKSLDVALKIAGFEKIPSGNLWLRST